MLNSILLYNQEFISNNSYTARKTDNTNFISLQINNCTNFPDSVTFTASYSKKCKKAINYVKNVRNYYETKGQKLESLSQLDLNKLDGILDRIKVFKGMSIKDFYLLTGLHDILMQRGCPNCCSHCFVEAKKLTNIMKWKNIKKLAKGKGEAIKRLGFNPFNDNIYPTNVIFPYLDSEPMVLKSMGKNKKVHNIAKAISLYYKKTGMPSTLTTTGWDVGDEWAQKAGKDLVKVVKKNPKVLDKFFISLNTYHQYMEKSLLYENKNNPELASKFRQKYVDRITNLIVTALPIFKMDHVNDLRTGQVVNLFNNKIEHRATILLAIAREKSVKGYSKEDTIKLVCDVLTNVENVCKKKGIKPKNYEFLTQEKDPRKNKFFSMMCELKPAGRAKKKFFEEADDSMFMVDKSNGKLKIITHGTYDKWNTEIVENIVYNTVRKPDFIDEFSILITPNKNRTLKQYKKMQEEGNVKEVARYQDKYIKAIVGPIKASLPLIQSGKAKINLEYSSKLGFTKEDMLKFGDDIINAVEQECIKENLNSKDYSFLTNEKNITQSPYITIKEVKPVIIQTYQTIDNPVFNVISSIATQNIFEFLRNFRKAVNTDGTILVNTGNRGPIDSHYAQLGDIKLNFKDPNNVPPKNNNFKKIQIDTALMKTPDWIIKRDIQYKLSPTNYKLKDPIS